MDKDGALIVFEDKNIRRTWFNEEWWFVIEDIIFALTNSKDPKGYIKDMKRRDETLSEGWGQIATILEVQTLGGKQRMNCASAKGIFRIIQSIPSKKAEPFKQWLSQVGYERVQEIQNPELTQKRMRELYRQKGYSDVWIEKRIRGIIIRDELTNEWKLRRVNEKTGFSILTAEISKAAFGMTPSEYKKFKGLDKENLRDHMNDLELIFTMLGEASTIRIAKNKDAKGFSENKKAAVQGGEISGIARKELEQRSKEKVSSSENYLDEPEKNKRKKLTS